MGTPEQGFTWDQWRSQEIPSPKQIEKSGAFNWISLWFLLRPFQEIQGTRLTTGRNAPDAPFGTIHGLSYWGIG